jgi:hypothetical protein
MMRTYPGQQSAALGLGLAIMHSEKPGTVMATRDMTSGSAYFNKVWSLRQTFGTIPDTNPHGIDHVGAMNHEPENDGTSPNWTWTPPTWAQAQVNFHNDVIVWVNQHSVGANYTTHTDGTARTHRMWSVAILMGVTGTSPARGYTLSDWFTSALISTVDILGFDNYNHNQFTAAETFCKAHGNKSWSVPEHGDSTGPNDPDDTVMATMKTDVTWIEQTSTLPPTHDLWFSANHNDLSVHTGTNSVGQVDLPHSRATWRAIDLAQGMPATWPF